MSSDYAFNVPAELELATRLRAARFFVTHRPWLDLYGVNVRPVAPFGSASSKPFVDPALIHQCLPDELLFEEFEEYAWSDTLLDVRSVNRPTLGLQIRLYNSQVGQNIRFDVTLGRAACVCRKWKYTVRNPVFWRNACLKAWQVSGVVENYKLLQSYYSGSWRNMWLLRPRVRFDGLYVSRNTYIRAGIAEWKITNPVHIVCYYRYLRFYPSGRFLYKNSSQKVKDVVKSMNFRTSKPHICHGGRYTLSDDKVEGALLYPGLRPTVWRIRLRLRGTITGANNRMDLLSIITSGVSDNEIVGPEGDILGVETWQEDETHNPDVPATSHKRGMTPFVFIPFEEFMSEIIPTPWNEILGFATGLYMQELGKFIVISTVVMEDEDDQNSHARQKHLNECEYNIFLFQLCTAS